MCGERQERIRVSESNTPSSYLGSCPSLLCCGYRELGQEPNRRPGAYFVKLCEGLSSARKVSKGSRSYAKIALTKPQANCSRPLVRFDSVRSEFLDQKSYFQEQWGNIWSQSQTGYSGCAGCQSDLDESRSQVNGWRSGHWWMWDPERRPGMIKPSWHHGIQTWIIPGGHPTRTGIHAPWQHRTILNPWILVLAATPDTEDESWCGNSDPDHNLVIPYHEALTVAWSCLWPGLAWSGLYCSYLPALQEPLTQREQCFLIKWLWEVHLLWAALNEAARLVSRICASGCDGWMITVSCRTAIPSSLPDSVTCTLLNLGRSTSSSLRLLSRCVFCKVWTGRKKTLCRGGCLGPASELQMASCG